MQIIYHKILFSYRILYPNALTLTHSSAGGGNEVIQKLDCDSREAEAKDSKRQAVKEDCCISLNVPRLEDTTLVLETSSSVLVMCFLAVRRGRKRLYEDSHDVTRTKNCAYEQTSGRLEKRSITRTTNNSKVSVSCSFNVNHNSKCGRVPKSKPDVPVGTCRKTDIEKWYAQFYKNKLVVQLKRLDENIRKLDDTVMSKKG
jgi:hypothetical protein